MARTVEMKPVALQNCLLNCARKREDISDINEMSSYSQLFSASKKKKKAKPKKSKESCRHIAFYQPHKKMNQNAQKRRTKR